MTQRSQAVGNYEFLGIVDKPKAGVTYKVRNLTTGEFEVLRALPGSSSSDLESPQRFLREIKMHTRLSHPNIIAFHDALELDGQLVMTAEFVEGTTLAELCQRGPLPSGQTIRVIGDVLSGLEEAHSLGIVHRGITAEHVMVTRDGEVKLGGFGLAKPASDVNLTQVGAVLGDARYMSPEQVIGIAPIDSRADLYSVGVLLFQALTGQVPFDGANDFEIMTAQVSGQPPRPTTLNSGVAPELERIVLKALAKKPEDRFADAKEFRQALAALKGPTKVPTLKQAPEAQPEAVLSLFVQPEPGGRPKTALVIGAVCFAVALLVVFLVAMHRA